MPPQYTDIVGLGLGDAVALTVELSDRLMDAVREVDRVCVTDNDAESDTVGVTDVLPVTE